MKTSMKPFKVSVQLLSVAAFLLLITLGALGANYVLSFDPSPTPNVTYRVYSSTNGSVWKFERTTTNTTVTLSNVPANVMAFGVSATNANGESAKATAEIIFAPQNLRIVEQ